jgi:hypothetical protein
MRLSIVLCLAAAALAAVAPAVHSGKATAFITSDLSGWEGLMEYWSYKDGALVGAAPDGLKFNTFLCSKEKYGDFELQFQIQLKDGAGNSGVQIRSEVFDMKKFAVKGPQCDIGGGYWGSLYGEHFGGMMKAAPKDAVGTVKTKDFNDYQIKCVGKHVTIKLNGAVTVDDDFSQMPAEGVIAWQLHAGGPMQVTFRNIRFKNLSK